MSNALCTNQFLRILNCLISNRLELKALLNSLMHMNNNPQDNTTLTLQGKIGGKEEVETLVDKLCTNTSLLELTSFKLEELSSMKALAIIKFLEL